MPNNEWPYVIAAYSAAWAALVGYTLYLHGVARRAERQRRLERPHGRAA